MTFLTRIALLLSVLALAACASSTNVETAASVPVNASHVWVTVKGLWVATDAGTLPDDTTGWTQFTLATPVTIDLATLASGTLGQIASKLKIPAGTYRQMHLELADAADTLASSASSANLSYNAQVSIADDAGTVTTAPLELAVPEAGLTFPVDFTISKVLPGNLASASSSSGSTDSTSASASLNLTATATLALDFDAARSLLAYAYGSNTGYLFNPVTTLDNEALAGAISGSVDLSALASSHAPVWVSAQAADSAQTHHVIVRRVPVASDGSFVLYPLPAASDGSTTYDVVISCAGADTVIVRGVPVSPGGVASATSLQTSAIALTAATTAYAALVAQSPALPAGSRVDFYQTVAGSGELPYLIASTELNPLTRLLPGSALPLTQGAIQTATYASGTDATLVTAAPAEGNGSYLIGSEAPYFTDTRDSVGTGITGTAGEPTSITAPVPTLPAGAVSGTLTVTLSVTAGGYDSGFLTVTTGNRLVETADVSSLLQRGGGTLTLSGLPAGSALVASGGVPYQVAVRAWASSDAAGSLRKVAGTASVALGDGGTGNIDVVLD